VFRKAWFKESATFEVPALAGITAFPCVSRRDYEPKGAFLNTLLGDGACWITDQMELQLGTQARYLVNFYHLGDYLWAAAVAASDKQSWMEAKKTLLKQNRWREVLKELEPFLEPADTADDDAPVRTCHRYINNRSNCLDYQGALAKDLLIGSGEIESAHRYILQNRLKIAGACWTLNNLAKMVALRVVRANRGWEDYWSEIGRQAA